MRWPDAHGCANQVDHEEYIHDLWELKIASLTPRQQLRRWWRINWPGAITILALALAALVVGVLA